ncbi:unnamed protein product [Prunus armeniaca]
MEMETLTRLKRDLVDANRAVALAHSKGTRDGFQQGISYFRDKAKAAYSFVDWDNFPIGTN